MHQIIQIIGLMDSLRGKNNSIKNYEEKLYQYQEQEAEILIDMGALCLDDEQTEEALKYFHEALNTYQKMEYLEGKAFTHDLIGDTYLSIKKTSHALKHYQKAYEIYYSLESPLEDELSEKIGEVMELQETLGISSENGSLDTNEIDTDLSGDTSIAIKSDSSLKHSKIPASPKKSVPTTMDNIADELETAIMLLNNSSMYEKYYKEANGIDYLEEALQTADVIEDWEAQGTLHLMLGDSHLKVKKVEEALKHFKKAYEIFEDNDIKLGIAVSLLLLGTIYFIQDKEQSMYKFFKESLKLFRELKDKKGEKIAINILEMLSE